MPIYSPSFTYKYYFMQFQLQLIQLLKRYDEIKNSKIWVALTNWVDNPNGIACEQTLDL